MSIGFYSLAMVVVLLLVIAIHSSRSNPFHLDLVLCLAGGAAVCFLLGIWAIGHGKRSVLAYELTEGNFVFLKGVHPNFLQALPEMPPQVMQANAPVRAKQRTAPYGAWAHAAVGLGGLIIVGIVSLFVLSRALNMSEEAGQSLRILAFWGGLAALHIAVLGGILLIFLSQSYLEWRLGLAASLPLAVLVLITAGQDFLLISSANQEANRAAVRAKNKGSNSSKATPAKKIKARNMEIRIPQPLPVNGR